MENDPSHAVKVISFYMSHIFIYSDFAIMIIWQILNIAVRLVMSIIHYSKNETIFIRIFFQGGKLIGQSLIICKEILAVSF